MKNQINRQVAAFLEPMARETRDATKELETRSIHSAKVKDIRNYKKTVHDLSGNIQILPKYFDPSIIAEK